MKYVSIDYRVKMYLWLGSITAMSNKPKLRQKGRFGLQYRGTECPNCGHSLDLSDRYCPSCSQANSTKKLTLSDFFNEFFASLISYDSKLLKTLSALLTKPGKITQDYISGKRVSYTNPFRFLLSLAIIYFLMLNLSGDFSAIDRLGVEQFSKEGMISFSSKDQKDQDFDKTDKTLDSLNIQEIFAKNDSLILANPIKHFNATEDHNFFERFGSKRDFFSCLLRTKEIYTFNDVNTTYNIQNTRENRAAFNAAVSSAKFLKQPGSFFSNLISKLPFTIFFFLPVFALFIWVAYIRKKHTYAEHLIFSFHNQSLLFILLIVSFIVDAVFGVFSGWMFLIAFSIYLFLAMRKFYQQGLFKTIVKYVFLNAIFFILAMFTMVLLLTGSIFTY